jgi:transcriptional regulator with XRE-family HTH domain
MRDFGVELRRRRSEAGLSLSQLAERVHYNKGYLSKIENGQKAPSEALARQCDVELKAGGDLRALAARPVPTASEPAPVPGAGDSWILHQGPGRTIFMPHSTSDGPLPATALISELGSRAVLTDSGLTSFVRILLEYRRLGHQTGPSALLPGLISQTRVLMNLAGDAAEPMRTKVFGLAGQYAEYTGWLTQEAGDDRAALWWTDLAVDLALRADQKDMASHALVRKALVSMYREDGRRTVELAVQAQQDTRASPRVRGLAAQREAQGHALTGDFANCQRALDCSAELLMSHACDEDQDQAGLLLGPTSISDFVQLATGCCLLDLGQPARSAEILDAVVAGIPQTAQRSRARYGARRALAYSAAQEVDHACALAGDVLQIAELVDSATIRIELRSLRRSLSRWSAHPPVRQIMPRLADALT